MKKILIHTIFRNSEKFMETYYEQVKLIVQTFPEIEFYFSAYENDSVDSTSQILKSKDWSFFKDYSVICQTIGSKSYFSSKEEDRVRNLSKARNISLGAKDFLSNVDYVMIIDCDMKYSMETVGKILNFDQKEDFDIVSGLTWQMPGNEWEFYDKWATRTTNTTEYYERMANEDLCDLVPNWRELEYGRYFATSNGICLYRAKPFQEGIRYGYISPTAKISDCEQSVLCEEFILSGYDKIFIIHDALIEHIGWG